MDFPDIIYRNNNYVENLHATGNNENKNMIFIQQFYIPKQYVISKHREASSTERHFSQTLTILEFCSCVLFYV